MNGAGPVERDLIFISKATPGDDQFVLWLAPRLEAAGYKVFADIFDLDAGDEWRGKLTAALQTRAIKMLLCCSDETLARRGVREEIAIAEDLTKQLQDPNFIIPLKVRASAPARRGDRDCSRGPDIQLAPDHSDAGQAQSPGAAQPGQ
ncbi:MAG TPA: toll/interleukin-1 receptor domain-containing protein [Candidatus Binataceae bacterium]|nr:toll/interleukin-1 receptor domain-containing protein [Candidatus Binataceae bacterium]